MSPLPRTLYARLAAALVVLWGLSFEIDRLVLRFETNDEVWLDHFGQPATNELLGQGLRRRGVID